MQCLGEAFNLDSDDSRQFSMEVDPRTISPDQLKHLRDLGFNRLSFGVQDFDPDVQAAVNRIQSDEQVTSLIHAAREYGFRATQR
jgi:oxygen-independent coproporphyrinogen-3 oxidase